jgi:alkylation response protein AidB-like acyl-CoA dehydrogenase
VSADDELWLSAAEGVLAGGTGRAPLDALEWNALGDLAAEHERASFAALFRAQGRVLGTSSALGALVANRLLEPDASDVGVAAVTRARHDGGRIRAVATAGFDDAERVVVELDDGDGLSVLVGDRAAWEGWTGATEALDPDAARSVQVGRAALEVVLPSEAARTRLPQVHAVARMALAHEILGVCDRLMDLATTYAHDREQFGAPIGSFQAVAHMLAEAEVARRSLADACDAALARSGATGPDPREAVLLKGLAGRTVRRVAQRTLQTFGAVGFTWEHSHHRYARRGLTLDALFGSLEEMRVLAVTQLADDGAYRPALV